AHSFPTRRSSDLRAGWRCHGHRNGRRGSHLDYRNVDFPFLVLPLFRLPFLFRLPLFVPLLFLVPFRVPFFVPLYVPFLIPFLVRLFRLPFLFPFRALFRLFRPLFLPFRPFLFLPFRPLFRPLLFLLVPPTCSE